MTPRTRKSSGVGCRRTSQRRTYLLNSHPRETSSLLVVVYCKACLRPTWYEISKSNFKFEYFSPFRTGSLSDIPGFLNNKNIYEGHIKSLFIWIWCIKWSDVQTWKVVIELSRMTKITHTHPHTHTHTHTHILVVGGVLTRTSLLVFH
jgi:hypothetical protein